MSEVLWNWIFMVVGAIATVFASTRCVHVLQLESYQNNMYSSWISRAGKSEVFVCLLSGIAALLLRMGWMLLYYMSPVLNAVLWYGCDLIYILAMIYIGFNGRKQQEKKPLVYTGRVIRLMLIVGILSMLFHRYFFLDLKYSALPHVLIMNVLRYLPGMLLPYFVLCSNTLISPIENAIKKSYAEDAKKNF